MNKLIVCFFLSFIFISCSSSSGAWSDVKEGTRKIVGGAAKGVKSAATAVEENMEEDRREEAEEASREGQ